MWSTVKSQEQTEKAKGEMEAGRRELLQAVEEKRRVARERYEQTKHQSAQSWEAAKSSVGQVTSGNLFLLAC